MLHNEKNFVLLPTYTIIYIIIYIYIILPCCLENRRGGGSGIFRNRRGHPKWAIVFKMEGLNPYMNYALATHENGYQPSENVHTTIGWSIQHF